MVNGEPVDALSLIVHRDKAYAMGDALTRKLKEVALAIELEQAHTYPAEQNDAVSGWVANALGLK